MQQISMAINEVKNQRGLARGSDLPPSIVQTLSEKNKEQLAEMLSNICSLQKMYGKTQSELEILVEGFSWALGSYKMREISEGFQEYIRNNSDIPAPNDIKKLIDARKGQAQRAANPESCDDWLKRFHADQELKMTRCYTVAGDYVDRFTSGNDRLKALPQWQQSEMVNCVHQAAFLQAQLIEGIKNCGYGAPISSKTPKWQENLYWWLEMCSRNAKTGAINVEAPWAWYEQPTAVQ